MANPSASRRTMRAPIHRVCTLLLSILAVVAVAPAHAASCDSAASIAADLWDEYGDHVLRAGCDAAGVAATAASSGATGNPGDAADACLDNATKREQLVRQMIATWNRLAQNRWATIGPRQLLLDASHRGTIFGSGSRLLVTPAPVHTDVVDLVFEKEALRGAAAVTVCSYAPGGPMVQRMHFSVASGEGNIGKKWLQRIDRVKGQLLSVHIVGMSLTKQMQYTVEVGAVEGAAARATATATPASPPDASAPPPPPRVAAGGDHVATCRASLPGVLDPQRAIRGLPSRNAAARPGAIARPSAPPVARAVAAPPPRPVLAYAPDGGWVLAHGTRSFARGLPDEASDKLREFTGAGRSVDAIAFTPGGGWTIVAGDASWTRNVGGGYHAALTALLAEGRQVRAVAFNPLQWNARRGFVLAHDAGFTAAHIPDELCAQLKAFTRAGVALDAVAFTPKGGWTAVAGERNWTRNVGGPRPNYHGGLTDALAAGARVHAVAFEPARQGAADGWVLLTDRGYRGRGLPGEAELQLVRMLGLRNQAGE